MADTTTLVLTLTGQQISGTVIQSGLQTSLLNNDAGFIVNLTAFDTDDLAEGATNKYWSQALFDAAFGAKTTTNLAEGTNLYYTSARFTTDFNTKTTDNLTEGTTNKYFTTVNFDAAFNTKDTDDLAEGVVNLYYTSARFSADLATKDTDDLAEGATNKYYSDALFGTSLALRDSDDVAEGVTNLYYSTARFDADFATKDTDDLTEGVTALYWTDGRFDSRLATKDTDDLAEGSTNLYYTDTRVSANTDVAANTAARHAAATVSDTTTLDLTLVGQQISGSVIQSGLQTSLLNNDAGFIANLTGFDTDDLVEGSTNKYFSDALFGTSLATRDTDDLAEGATNLYYTLARFNTAFSGKSTTDLAEGTNLYWTQLRFDTAFSGKDTDDLAEGVTNLYYSDALVSANSDVAANTAARHDAATVLDSSTIDFSISGQQITGSVLADSLNFTELADALTLDASTSIALGSNNLSTSGTGGITLGHTGVTSFAGQVGLGTSSPHARLDLADGGANGSFLIGADVNTTTRTTNTRKIGRIVAPNYADDGTGFNIFILGADTNATDNLIDFGGVASGTPYAATKIRFYTAANNTTQGGTEAMQINNSQNVGIGLTPGAIHRLHVRATSNQFRADYDASNAFALSVNSTGQVTMDTHGYW